MKYKLIIFDFDGTLADSFPWFVSVINDIADQFKFRRIEEDEYEALRGLEIDKIFKQMNVPLWKMPLIGSRLKKLMSEQIHHISLFDGMDSLLNQLSKMGTMLAVVSSNSYENICRVLGEENAALIRYYECGVSFFGKTAKIKRVVSKSGMLPAESIYIGDVINDIDAAHKARIPSGAVAWGYNHIDLLKAHAPREVFFSVEDIARLVT